MKTFIEFIIYLFLFFSIFVIPIAYLVAKIFFYHLYFISPILAKLKVPEPVDSQIIMFLILIFIFFLWVLTIKYVFEHSIFFVFPTIPLISLGYFYEYIITKKYTGMWILSSPVINIKAFGYQEKHRLMREMLMGKTFEDVPYTERIKVHNEVYEKNLPINEAFKILNRKKKEILDEQERFFLEWRRENFVGEFKKKEKGFWEHTTEYVGKTTQFISNHWVEIVVYSLLTVGVFAITYYVLNSPTDDEMTYPYDSRGTPDTSSSSSSSSSSDDGRPSLYDEWEPVNSTLSTRKKIIPDKGDSEIILNKGDSEIISYASDDSIYNDPTPYSSGEEAFWKQGGWRGRNIPEEDESLTNIITLSERNQEPYSWQNQEPNEWVDEWDEEKNERLLYSDEEKNERLSYSDEEWSGNENPPVKKTQWNGKEDPILHALLDENYECMYRENSDYEEIYKDRRNIIYSYPETENMNNELIEAYVHDEELWERVMRWEVIVTLREESDSELLFFFFFSFRCCLTVYRMYLLRKWLKKNSERWDKETKR